MIITLQKLVVAYCVFVAACMQEAYYVSDPFLSQYIGEI